MAESRQQTIAVAGVGDFGKFICEELQKDIRYKVVVLSRDGTHEWARQKGMVVYKCPEYRSEAVLHALNQSNATALISFISAIETYVDIHRGLANACLQSTSCKRFIPSEWIGNIDDFPHLPRYYGATRGVFREELRKMTQESADLQWTLIGVGWLIDYLVMPGQTYMKPYGDWHTIDLETWEVCIRGTGDEMQSWVCARDVGRAICELLAISQWELVIYIATEWASFNTIITRLEEFYGKAFVRKTPKSLTEIQQTLTDHVADIGNQDEYLRANLDEWTVESAAACPQQKTLRQRDAYFTKIDFLGVQDVLELAVKQGFV